MKYRLRTEVLPSTHRVDSVIATPFMFARSPVGGAADGLAVNRRDLPFGGFPNPLCPFDE